MRQCAVLGNNETSLVELPPSEKFLGPQSKGLGDVGSNGDLWRSLSGEVLKFWAESLPDTACPSQGKAIKKECPRVLPSLNIIEG